MSTHSSASTVPTLVETPSLGVIAKLAYALMVIGVLILAASGIGTFLLGKAPMTHWILMLHVGASPTFAIGLAVVTMTWPGRDSGQSGISRFFFWLMVLAGFVVILSGVVPMTPLFGTEGQHLLYLTHRYASFAVVGLMLLHLLTLRSTRR